MTKTQPKPKPIKPKKCRCGCGRTFTPQSSTQVAYGWECALKIAEKARVKREQAEKKIERKTIKEAKEKLKTRRDWMKEAQAAFNQYIRLRDQLAGHPCICCDRPLDWSGNATDAGHYRSVGSAPHLRFDERNVHAQAKQCNHWGAGRAVDYRIGLIKRIGLEQVEYLEADQTPKKWTADQLKEKRDQYRIKSSELKKILADAVAKQ